MMNLLKLDAGCSHGVEEWAIKKKKRWGLEMWNVEEGTKKMKQIQEH